MVLHDENRFYDAEFDNVDKDQWDKVFAQFSDANIYQTWCYDAVQFGEDRISHFVLRTADGSIAAAAQVRIVTLPLFDIGVAYIRWGPLWQPKDQAADSHVFRVAIRALKKEYAENRGHILRLFPSVFGEKTETLSHILLEEGFSHIPEQAPKRTLILDITPPVSELRKNMLQKWRNCLNKAERNGLEVVEGTEDNLFQQFIDMYRNLLDRKKFSKPNDINQFRLIQRELPDDLKMRVLICRSENRNSAGGIFTAIGETGVYLFGATVDEGMKNSASYLIQLKAIEWMKNSGCRYYNLNGINPQENPGTYHFKAGLSGKSGKDVYYAGQFECYSGAMNVVLSWILKMAFPLLKAVLRKVLKLRHTYSHIT